MLKEIVLQSAAMALFCILSWHCSERFSDAQSLEEGGSKVHKTREEVRSLFPRAKWIEINQGEASFMFCANDLPAYGNSRMEIQGWVFRRHSKVWETVLTVRLDGVVDVTLSVDPKTRLFSAKGSADNKFKDQSVCTYDLRTAE